MRKNLEKFPRSPIWRQDDWERTPLRFFKRRQKELGKLSQKLLLLQTSIDISKFSAGVLGSGMVYGIWWNQDIIIHSVNLSSFLLPPKWIRFSRSLVWALDFLRKTGNQRFSILPQQGNTHIKDYSPVMPLPNPLYKCRGKLRCNTSHVKLNCSLYKRFHVLPVVLNQKHTG